MITVDKAFGWLNWENPSHLRKENQFSVWQISDTKIAEAERNAIIETMVHCSEEMTDPLERAEVLSHCGVVRFNKQHREEAKRLLVESFRVYKEQKDYHRQAVLEWCLGTVQRMLLENSQAYAHAYSARSLFNSQANMYGQMGEREAQRSLWYRDRVVDMTCDLALTPEEAFEWINKFNPTRLGPSAQQMREKIRVALNDKCFDMAYQLMGSLQKMTRRALNPLETAEAQAYCGLVLSQMGNRPEAVKVLRKALASAIPDSHEHASIRWMAGIIQFNIPDERAEGVNNIEGSLACFENLKVRADQKNQKSAMVWYDAQVEAMQLVLKDLIRNDP